MKMAEERYRELEFKNGALTKEELENGWHFCPEWDYMLLGGNDNLLHETCSCNKPKLEKLNEN